MNHLNSVLIEGNLIADPIQENFRMGKTRVQFTIESIRYVNLNDEKKAEVSRFEIEVWNKTAELCVKTLKEGSGVRVVGRMKRITWHEDEKIRSKIVIVGDTVEIKTKWDKKPSEVQP